MSQQEVVDLTIDLVATVQNRDPADLLQELESKGADLPIDSQLIAEVLARVEEQCGARINADSAAARSLRSVRTFADTIVAAVHSVIEEEVAP